MPYFDPTVYNTFLQTKPLLSTERAAAWLGITPDTLLAWIRAGRGPRYVQVNQKTIRFRLVDLIHFAESQVRQ